MEENQNLSTLLGLIYQSVNYGQAGINDLDAVQSFCNELKAQLNSDDFTEQFEEINWKNYIVYNQIDCKRSGFSIYRRPIETGDIPAELAPKMLEEFQELEIDRKYRKSLQISRGVADEIFKNGKSEVKIVLGEDNGMLIFMYVDDSISTDLKYYILNNRLWTQEIDLNDFSNYINNYENGLKKILDDHIKKKSGVGNAFNTRRFTLGRILYDELLRQSGRFPNVFISFYPALYILDDFIEINVGGVLKRFPYKHRFTFIMILEYYDASTRKPLLGTGVYDRNGLCPPPDDSNC